MSLLHLAFIIARRRIASSWRLELVLFLGILLAVTLLSSGVVFSDLLAEAALRRALTQASKEEANILVRVSNDLDDPRMIGRRSLYQSNVDLVEQWVTSRFEALFPRPSPALANGYLLLFRVSTPGVGERHPAPRPYPIHDRPAG